MFGLGAAPACGGRTGDGTDAGVDGAADAGAEAGPCDPNVPRLPQQPCTADLVKICQDWAAQAAAPAGAYGSASCIVDSVTGHTDCTLPTCDNGICGCGSSNVVCQSGQVCASDTPGGPLHCVTACKGL